MKLAHETIQTKGVCYKCGKRIGVPVLDTMPGPMDNRWVGYPSWQCETCKTRWVVTEEDILHWLKACSKKYKTRLIGDGKSNPYDGGS